MVKKQNLILIAGIVWIIAGVNVLALGVQAFGTFSGWMLVPLFLGAVAIFYVFHAKMFSNLVHKHTQRIRAYREPRQPVWKFFDAKGYVLMAVMMGGGISLRTFGLVPTWFIAFFYTGIGCALALAGIGFLVARAHDDGYRFHRRNAQTVE